MHIGKVHSVDEYCKTSVLLSVEGSIKKLLYIEKTEALAVITENLMLSQYALGPEGGAQEIMKVYRKIFKKYILTSNINMNDQSQLL